MLFKLKNKEKAAANGKQASTSGEADVAEEGCIGELLTVYSDKLDSTDEWILDSGCTFHMCHNRSWFYTFEKVNQGYVLMGNNTTCPVVGHGSVRIRMFDGVIRTIGNVRYVPDLRRNLLSLSSFDKKRI